MIRWGKLPVWFWTTLALSLGASGALAQPPANPYAAITARNVFGLRSPLPVKPPEPPPAPLPAVKLVGITTFGAAPRALLKVSLPAKPPEPAKEHSCILTVGEREGPVEVMAINAGARTATVNNSGTVMMLELGKNSSQPQPMPRLNARLSRGNQYVFAR